MNQEQTASSTGAPRTANFTAQNILQNVFKPKTPPVEQNAMPKSENTAEQLLTKLDERKTRAAANLRISSADVETMPFDLSALEADGIFMNIDASGFGALERQLEWKSLGVELPPGAAIRLSPPRVGLLPDVYRKNLMRAQSQAHQALNKFSFRFTLCETVWGTSEYKWIPWSAFEQFEAEYLRAQETLACAKQQTLEKYDEILVTLRRSFAELAEDSAKRLDATLQQSINREEFAAAVVGKAMSMIPTREQIRDGLTITMKPKVIILGSEIIAEQQRSKELGFENARIDRARREIELELDTKQQIEQLKLADFEREQRREREIKERIRQLKVEAAEREAQEAVSPLKEGLSQITAKIYEAAKEMAERMQGADFVPGVLAKRARQMCEWYKLMNFTGDHSLEEVLVKLEAAADKNVKARSTGEMRAALDDVLRATSTKTRKLLEESRLTSLEI